MRKWSVVPYLIFGVSLFSAEANGYVFVYCDDRLDAQSHCDWLNSFESPFS